MSFAGKKRKLAEGEMKYYAVKAGKRPGVYLTWAECQANTTGFKGAVYKSFPSKKEADDFVAGRAATTPGQPDKWYGVAVGKVPGVYTQWPDALKQITDVKGPKYKKFETREEAEEFVRSGGKVSAPKGGGREGKKGAEATGKAASSVVEEPKKKKTRLNGGSTGEGNMVRVYTDGSARGNGQAGARAGVGVFFGVDDPRNLSEPLAGSPQTNNRAELTAILRALQTASLTQDMEIITDSDYSINCSTVWYSSWQRRGWTTSAGKAVENVDLIKGIRELVEARDREGRETRFTWVRGHNMDVGNEAADRLAVRGAMGGR